MVTVEDAINAHIRYCEKQKHPSHNSSYNHVMDIWIRTLKSAPRDVTEIQKVIDRKERQRKATLTLEQADPIYKEIQALEWVSMILRGSDKERENWAKLT
jgi:hypothetical protein